MQHPVRIAQMMTEMTFGGVEMVVMNYYRHMDHHALQFDFVVMEGSLLPQREEILSLGGRIHMVPHYTRLAAYEKALIALFRKERYPIVHSHMNTLSVFSLGPAWLTGVPVRICHNHSTAVRGETKKNIFKYTLRPFTGLFATQRFACSRVAGSWCYGKTPFRVIKNAIDLALFRYSPQRRNRVRQKLGLENAFVVGHIGRFCYPKNHAFLLDIFQELHRRRPQAVLLLAGSGELEEAVRRKTARLGLTDSVRFLGNRSDTPDLYQAMDVFLLPSRYEGLPVVGVEAQAAGLPLVISDRVPPETLVLPSARICPLAAPVAVWADTVAAAGACSRVDSTRAMADAGFDIRQQAARLAETYLALARGTYSQEA